MEAVSTVTAVSGEGILRDASYGKRNRQMLLIDSETLSDFQLNPGDVRENVTLANFDLTQLLPLDRVQLGEIVLGVTSVTPQLALRVILLLGLGFAILLSVPPFHYWLPSIVEKVNPYSLAFVAIILQSSGLFFLLRFLDNFAWMRADPLISSAIQAAGILMIVFGTIVAVAQVSFLKIAVYVLVADIGVSLLAIGTGLESGTEVAIGLSSVRVVGLVLWGLGAAIMSKSGYSTGAGRAAPLATAAALLGVLSLAGQPLTAGFPWRWTLLAQLSESTSTGAILMVISMFAVLWVVLRWIRVLYAPGPTEAEFEPRADGRVAVALMAGACLILGIFPQLATPWVSLATAGIANLSP